MKKEYKKLIIDEIFKDKSEIEIKFHSISKHFLKKEEEFLKLNKNYNDKLILINNNLNKKAEEENTSLKDDFTELFKIKKSINDSLDLKESINEKDMKLNITKEIISSYIFKIQKKYERLDIYLSYFIAIILTLTISIPMLTNKNAFVAILGVVCFSLCLAYIMVYFIYKKKFYKILSNIFYSKYLFKTESNFQTFKNSYVNNICLNKETKNTLIINFYFSQIKIDDLEYIYNLVLSKYFDKIINNYMLNIDKFYKNNKILEEILLKYKNNNNVNFVI